MRPKADSARSGRHRFHRLGRRASPMRFAQLRLKSQDLAWLVRLLRFAHRAMPRAGHCCACVNSYLSETG